MVINTGPLLSLVAATGNLDVLRQVRTKVVVPVEVANEIYAGETDFAKRDFREDSFISRRKQKTTVSSMLSNSLDEGEAAVIQTAIDLDIPTVCIDEAVGRRIARLHGLKVTGSLGILIAAKKGGYDISIREAVCKMHEAGIWLSEKVKKSAIDLAGE